MSDIPDKVQKAKDDLDLCKIKTREAERAYNEALNGESLAQMKFDEAIFSDEMQVWMVKSGWPKTE